MPADLWNNTLSDNMYAERKQTTGSHRRRPRLRKRYESHPFELYTRQTNKKIIIMNKNLKIVVIMNKNTAYLAFGSELLLVAVRGVSWDLTGPEVQAHHQVSTAHHQQRKEVDQDGHTHMIPATQIPLVTPEL